jgi:hypothetical protein
MTQRVCVTQIEQNSYLVRLVPVWVRLVPVWVVSLKLQTESVVVVWVDVLTVC